MNAIPPLQPQASAAPEDDPRAPAIGVYLSDALDLKAVFGEARDPRLVLLRPEEVEDPAAVVCALCWQAGPQAFAPYPNLKLAGSIAAGVDHILSCPSLPADAVVTRVRDDSQADLMAGFAAFHVVWHHRRMDDFHEWNRRGEWRRTDRPAEPCETTVGVLGYGMMGRAVARAVSTLGFRVVAAARSPAEGAAGIEVLSGPDAIGRTAERAQILINVLPLTAETRDVLDAALFARMPKGACLIQIGRGEHMVEEDLLAALNSGQVAAASVDVFRQEPPRPDHPFWAHPRVFVTPHRASDTSRHATVRQLADAMQALAEGRDPDTRVDRRRGY
ncbi:NAD(P)-dependent oxidoreductase [Albimonas sp. CAU 1670]|uniref:NAD(P)-dependent oxidoreductase n=1 Tax=Albimonas sp. CAU 1670 TaxID=3032599 RepID=UPI0023DC2EB3|nr:NAD(P)-dependent oxidoreductase [Albimonas sp. CAU 1670]MDF2235023.1 NAD(P)-dependent oxidoreductase [Albimonas sp. CAU 1670]